MRRLLPSLLPLLAVALSMAQSKSGISDADLKKIRSTGQRFLVPGSVPKGYKVTKVQLDAGKTASETTLEIVYTKGKGVIYLEECSEGIGDVIFEDDADPKGAKGRYRFTSAVFGRAVLEYQTAHGQSQWLVNWQKLPGKRFPRFVSATGRGSNPRDGLEFMKGLEFLK